MKEWLCVKRLLTMLDRTLYIVEALHWTTSNGTVFAIFHPFLFMIINPIPWMDCNIKGGVKIITMRLDGGIHSVYSRYLDPAVVMFMKSSQYEFGNEIQKWRKTED